MSLPLFHPSILEENLPPFYLFLSVTPNWACCSGWSLQTSSLWPAVPLTSALALQGASGALSPQSPSLVALNKGSGAWKIRLLCGHGGVGCSEIPGGCVPLSVQNANSRSVLSVFDATVVPLPAVPAPSGFLPCIPSFPSWSGPCAGLRWLARGENLARLLFTAVQYSCLSRCQAFQVSFGSPLGCCQKAEGQAACHGYRPRPRPLSRLPRCLSWEQACSASSPPFPSSIGAVSQSRIVHELCRHSELTWLHRESCRWFLSVSPCVRRAAG